MRAPRKMQRITALTVGCLVGASALSACSSSSSSATSTTRTTTLSAAQRASLAAAEAPCSLLAPAEIQSLTGTKVSRPVIQVHGRVTSCNYKAAHLPDSVVIQYQFGATSASFASGRAKVAAKVGPTSSAGFPFQSYEFNTTSGSLIVNSVVTLVGSLQTVVTGTASMRKIADVAGAVVAAAQAAASTTTTTSTPATGPSPAG